MRKFYKSLVVLALVLLVTLLVAGAALAGGRPLVSHLLGANEAPVPGDPDGEGWARITLNQGLGEICWEITFQGIEPVTAAHIHRAPAGSPGPVVFPIPVPGGAAASSLRGCGAADPALVKAIRQDPGAYYLNVHNAPFPGGALRDQMHKPED